jgi:hypothetical protein
MRNWTKVAFAASMMLMIGNCCRHYNMLSVSDLRALKTKNIAVDKKAIASLAVDDTSNFKLDTLPQTDGFIELNWKMLAKTTFTPLKVDSIGGLIVLMPKFPRFMRALEGKNVMMSGFIIPVEETGDFNTLVLSANSFTTCFFCGQAGPETVMDIHLKNPKSVKRFKKDDKVMFKGQLKLNDTDYNYFNYIIEDAELVN